MKQIIFSLSALLLCGCAMTQVEVSPANNVAEAKVEPKMYIDNEPTNELLLEKEKESYVLRHAPQRSSREAIVENAMMYLGKRDGGDCSGFVNLINLKTGRPFYNEKELSASFDNARKSRAMFNLMSKKGNAYEARLPNLGDLVFFENTERRATPKTKKIVKSKTKNGKKEIVQKKAPVPNVAENITHVGIVTKVEADGTVEFIHHSNGKNILDYMNFNYPMLTHKDGKKINTYMKRCPSKGGAAQPQCMNIAFFVAYGTF